MKAEPDQAQSITNKALVCLTDEPYEIKITRIVQGCGLMCSPHYIPGATVISVALEQAFKVREIDAKVSYQDFYEKNEHSATMWVKFYPSGHSGLDVQTSINRKAKVLAAIIMVLKSLKIEIMIDDGSPMPFYI